MKPNPSAPRLIDRDDPVAEERPFFYIVIAVLVGLYLLALYNSPAARAPERFIPFTLLMLLHIVLHWNSPSLVETRPRSIAYLSFQGALAFALPLIASSPHLVVGLAMTMIGESVGILRKPLAWATAIVVYLVLAALDLILLGERGVMETWMLIALPMTLFVVIYVTMYSRQGEARARAQALLAELESAHSQLSEYALRVEDLTIANERQRMARELHDTLAQGLARLILQLEAADAHLASGNVERAQSILKQAMSRARGTLADARRAIDDLRVGQPGVHDLTAALRDEAGRFTDATAIVCEVDASLLPALSDAANECVVRAVREGLTNIAQHAQARHVWIDAKREGAEVTIDVRDDGRGFDASSIPPGHYGLLGIRERARLAGGELELISAPVSGTVLRLRLPIGEAGQPAASEIERQAALEPHLSP